jgi:hypothetical protein
MLSLVGQNSDAYSANHGLDRPDTLAIAPSALFHTSPECYISVMTTAEDIEKAVEQLAPRERARFVRGSRPSTRRNSMLPSSGTRAPASLMRRPKRLSPGSRATCEASRFGEAHSS